MTGNVVELTISQKASGVYTWVLGAEGRAEPLDEWSEPENSIESCLVIAGASAPDNALISVTYRGIRMGTWRRDQLTDAADTAADRIVADYASLAY